MPIELNYQELRNLYVIQRLTLIEIGNHYGISPYKVERELRRHNIHRSRAKAETKYPRDYLEHLYLEKKLRRAEVADALGVSVVTVQALLRHYGIRSPELGHRHKLRLDVSKICRLYLEDRMPVKEIARKLGCGVTTIRARLKEAGVKPTYGRGIKRS